MRIDAGSHRSRVACPGGNHYTSVTADGKYRKHNVSKGVECEMSQKPYKRS
jgi:hypothetical protein